MRIATRESELALWQARHVASRIESELGREVELLPMRTRGDRLLDVSLAKLGGKGLFVKEIEEALLEGRADVAVHSAKDLPAAAPEGLVFAAIPARADPRDALVAAKATSLDALPRGAIVGTGSQRRHAQLARLRPDLEIAPLRGNVPTRLAKLDAGHFDAVVLASAGLDRLGLSDRIAERIGAERLLPAVGQGTLAIQTREDDPLRDALSVLADPETTLLLGAERACLARLGADCTVPLGAHARRRGNGTLVLRARLLSLDGATCLECEREAPEGDALELGTRAAEELLAAGGEALLAALRQST